MTDPQPPSAVPAKQVEDRQRMDYTPPVLARPRGGPVPPYQPTEPRRDDNTRRPQ